MKKTGTITIGALISIALLLLFVVLQSTNDKILSLPSHWLAVAVLPLIVALFIGGYIKSFKGFGIELEAALKAPVTSLKLTASDAVVDVIVQKKGDVDYLNTLSENQKNEVKSLQINTDKKHYYGSFAIERYLRELPNIQFFELKNETDKLIGFIPINAFKDPINPKSFSEELIQKLIDAINEGTVSKVFKDTINTLKIKSNQRLTEVLKTMRYENAEFAAVVSPSGKFIGVLFASEVEKKIADSVISVQAN